MKRPTGTALSIIFLNLSVRSEIESFFAMLSWYSLHESSASTFTDYRWIYIFWFSRSTCIDKGSHIFQYKFRRWSTSMIFVQSIQIFPKDPMTAHISESKYRNEAPLRCTKLPFLEHSKMYKNCSSSIVTKAFTRFLIYNNYQVCILQRISCQIYRVCRSNRNMCIYINRGENKTPELRDCQKPTCTMSRTVSFHNALSLVELYS